jgi:hypothetical protein
MCVCWIGRVDSSAPPEDHVPLEELYLLGTLTRQSFIDPDDFWRFFEFDVGCVKD